MTMTSTPAARAHATPSSAVIPQSTVTMTAGWCSREHAPDRLGLQAVAVPQPVRQEGHGVGAGAQQSRPQLRRPRSRRPRRSRRRRRPAGRAGRRAHEHVGRLRRSPSWRTGRGAATGPARGTPAASAAVRCRGASSSADEHRRPPPRGPEGGRLGRQRRDRPGRHGRAGCPGPWDESCPSLPTVRPAVSNRPRARNFR